jgi:hypothetical protein
MHVFLVPFRGAALPCARLRPSAETVARRQPAGQERREVGKVGVGTRPSGQQADGDGRAA